MGILGFLAVRTRWILFLVLAPALWAADGHGGLSEQELKAAALNQVVHFTRWPVGTFADADSALVIGIFGEDPFGNLIDELVQGEVASGHPVKVVRCFTPEAAAACHVVYVVDAGLRSTDRLLHYLSDRSILTVSGDEAFVERGGIICLTVRSSRIRILVNLEAAKRANVTLSSKLLRLAEIVKKP